MKKIVLLGVVVLLAAAPFVDPTGVLLGLLRRETFYRNRPTTTWKKSLRDGNPLVRTEALRALKDGGKDAIPVLAELVKAEDAGVEVRCVAIDFLGQLGEEGRAGAQVLTTALKDADPHIRKVAAAALGKISPTSPEAVPLLIDLLETDARIAAARTLSVYGPEAREAVAALQKLLKDPEGEMRWNAARTLGKIGPDARPAVPLLIAATTDEDALVREHAAEALGDIGPQAREGVQALIDALKDKDPRVRRDAVRALGQIGAAAKPAIAAVRERLKDENAKVREAAVRTLELLGAAGEER